MRLFVFAFSLFFGLHLMAQDLPVDSASGKVIYEEIFDAPGSADELYTRALEWFDDFYPNARVVIEEKEPEKHKITAKHKFNLQIEDKKGRNQNVGFIIYDFKVWQKDNKVRYKIDEIHLEYKVYYGIEQWMDPKHEDADNNPAKLREIDAYFQTLIASLKEGMQPEEEPVDEDDW